MTDLAEICRTAAGPYLTRFADRMLPSHQRTLWAITACRTPALGGQLYECECGVNRPVYFSCRNRHCPKCQGGVAQAWLEKQRAFLLPTGYALATCTLPSELRNIARSEQRRVYSILIREAAHALLDVTAKRGFIGGEVPIMAVLHTWSRALIFHPHVHMLFSVGGLDLDKETWLKPSKRRYVLPSFALAKRFRERMERAFAREGLGETVPKQVWKKRWVAHVKKVGSGEKALLYLSRYVYRTAISDDRIETFDGSLVGFRWTDSQSGKTRHERLKVEEFLRRFLQHVLPRGFVRVRYYGLWAPRRRKDLAFARELLIRHATACGSTPPQVCKDPIDRSPPRSELRCPACGRVYRDPPTRIPRTRGPPWR